MNELLFPFFGSATIVFLLLPVCALLGRAALHVIERWGGDGIARLGTLRYLLLVVPTLLPLVWSVSAGLHQAETGQSVLACLLSHDLQELCAEPVLFAALLATFMLVRSWGVVSSLRGLRPGASLAGAEALRVARLVDGHEHLRPLNGRVIVGRDRLVGGSATVGLLRPVVVVDADFVNRCDDETLAGALAHELSHLRALDPARYFLLALAVRLNPFGQWLLGRDAAAWIYRREVQCDRAAVLAGAAPFGVARALLAAARPALGAVAHIRGGSASKLRLRVELLMAYAEKRPSDDVARGSWALGLAAVVGLVALAMPHVGGTVPLDALHTGVERLTHDLLP